MADIPSISTGLKQSKDGIWYSDETQSISYPLDGNETCFTIEEGSFWFKHRNNCILSVVKSYPPVGGGTVFDIGGGNGFVSLALSKAGFDVALVEPGQLGAMNARHRGLETVICATTEAAQFKPNSLPAVGLFDVVEHIEDDLAFLKSLKDLIKKQGRLYITVPAFPFLWSEVDIAAGHFRRYRVQTICEVVEQAGFKVEFYSYIFRFLPLPILLFRGLPYRIGLSRMNKIRQNAARDHATKKGPITRVIDHMLGSEIKTLKKNKKISFGGSCIVVAKTL